jgi:hypothetical protein
VSLAKPYKRPSVRLPTPLEIPEGRRRVVAFNIVSGFPPSAKRRATTRSVWRVQVVYQSMVRGVLHADPVLVSEEIAQALASGPRAGTWLQVEDVVALAAFVGRCRSLRQTARQIASFFGRKLFRKSALAQTRENEVFILHSSLAVSTTRWKRGPMASPAFMPEEWLLHPLDRISDPFGDDLCLDCIEPAGVVDEFGIQSCDGRSENLTPPYDMIRQESLQGMPFLTPDGLSREPTTQTLVAGIEVATARLLKSSDDSVAAEIATRANTILQVLVQNLAGDPCSLQAGPAHAPPGSSATLPHGKILSEVRRLEFEAAVLRRKLQMPRCKKRCDNRKDPRQPKASQQLKRAPRYARRSSHGVESQHVAHSSISTESSGSGGIEAFPRARVSHIALASSRNATLPCIPFEACERDRDFDFSP